MTNIINDTVPKQKWYKRLLGYIKKVLGLLIVFLVRWLNDFDLQLTNYIINPNHMELEDLGPTSNATKNKTYEQSLNWALRNFKVTNIALTGPYGSGKSSVIATFQAKHKEFRYLNVSLATFDKGFKDDGDWRQKVELSILQQLIYHVKNKELPDSRFKKISHTTTWEMVFVTIGLVLLGLSFFNIYKPDIITKFSWWQNLSKPNKDLINYISIGYFLLGVSTIIYKFYRTLKGLRFSKLGVTTGQLELADKEDKSIFNKHLDEIIYFFQVTRYNVIVIEDLDRFEDTEIFTKLREVNNLINNSRQVGHPVNFVYAVRDDMFKDTDRAKFFDIIIPVIPIINTSNSGDELNRKLDTESLEKPIRESFFNAITLYIQDMRLLINIINEFKIYLSQIGKGLDPEKLLAISIYKNLYPDEFAKLHKQDGDVYKFINTKKGFIETHLDTLDQEITNAEHLIKGLSDIKLQNVKELKSVYITEIFARIPNNSVLILNRKELSVAELLKDVNFDQLTLLSSLPYGMYRLGNYALENAVLQNSFSDIEKAIHTDSYQTRKNMLNAISDNEIQTHRALIKNHNRKKSEIQSYTIRQVMNSFPDFKLPEEFGNKPLLAFLVGEGYIDEHYPMYISYFIEGSLSQADMDFVQSINLRKALPTNHPLNNVEAVVTKWLSISNYAQTEILNVSFFNWVLSVDDREAEPRILFEQLASAEVRAMSFINNYIEHGKHLHHFMNRLAIHFPTFWDVLFDDVALDDSILDKYIQLILEHVSADLIVNFNDTGKFSTYLESMLDFVPVFQSIGNKQNLFNTFDKLNIVFLNINQTDEVEDILTDIYDNDRYVLTPQNLHVIFKAYPDLFKPFTANDLIQKQYTVIRSSKAKNLSNYVKSNINTYVKEVLLKIRTNTDESLESLLELLNDSNLDDALKEQLIIQQNAVIPSITAVDSDYWEWLLKNCKVKLTWNNLLDYYVVSESITDTLIIFLNQSQENDLIKENWHELIESDENGETAANLEAELLNEGQLKLTLYGQIADQAHNSYDNLTIEELDEQKVNTLIHSGTLDFTETTLNKVNSHFPSLVLPFIFKHEEEYLKLDWPLSSPHYIQLVKTNDITTDQKFEYLKRLTPGELDSSLALALGKFLNANTVGINSFSAEFRVALFATQPTVLDTVNLLESMGRYLTSDALLKLVRLLPEPYNALGFIHKKSIFYPWSDVNDKLLIYLETHLQSIISTVTIDEKKYRWRVNFRRER